jgi:hypothetical protein
MTNRAGIFERTADIGASAVDLVVQRLHNNELGPPLVPRSVCVEGSWIHGLIALPTDQSSSPRVAA